MSAGSKIVPVRIPADLEVEIAACISSRNSWTTNVPWTMSDFIRAACWEKIQHMTRSRRPKTRRPKEVEPYAG